MYAIFCTNITSNRALNKRKSYRLARFHQKLGQFTIPIAQSTNIYVFRYLLYTVQLTFPCKPVSHSSCYSPICPRLHFHSSSFTHSENTHLLCTRKYLPRYQCTTVVSCLTGQDWTKPFNVLLFVCSKANESKPVKVETSHR